MTTSRILTLSAAALALAAPTAAVAADGGKTAFEAKPFLVATSNGAYVDYTLTRKATSTVTIDGAKAKVRTLDAPTYRAIVQRPSLDVGKTYTVKITVARPGKDLVRVDRLKLRRSAPVEG